MLKLCPSYRKDKPVSTYLVTLEDIQPYSEIYFSTALHSFGRTKHGKNPDAKENSEDVSVKLTK